MNKKCNYKIQIEIQKLKILDGFLKKLSDMVEKIDKCIVNFQL